MEPTHGDLDVFEVQYTPGAPGDYGQLLKQLAAAKTKTPIATTRQ